MNREQPDNAEFSFSRETGSGCNTCPLAQIPATVWLRIFRQPFRKRHPLLFWLLILALIAGATIFVHWASTPDEEIDNMERLALVTVQGAILDPGPTLAWIRKLESKDTIKGVLVRVNSPGGGAAASQEIYAALARVAKKMPVVVSMGATAASGGLMISMAGERIFANPSTVTGSIGVRMDIPQLQGLMQKIGVGQETLVTAPFKDAASYMHPLTTQDRAYLEKVLMDMHGQFVDIVAKGRRMPREKAEDLANGKIFTGAEAVGLGLVDETGGQYEAHAWLAQKTGVPMERKLAVKPAAKAKLLEELLAMGKAVRELLTAASADGLAEKMSAPMFLYQF